MTKEQIRALMELAHLDQTGMANAIKVHRLSLRAWLVGKSVPEAKNVRRLWALAKRRKVEWKDGAWRAIPKLDRESIVEDVLARVRKGLASA